VLEFRSNNSTHRPVLDALDLITRYANAGNLRYYPADEHIPAHRGLSGDWDALMSATDTRRRRRVVRMVYEVCTFQALALPLRRLTAEDQRGLTPLFWSHVLPYGEVKLNMTSRLSLGTT